MAFLVPFLFIINCCIVIVIPILPINILNIDLILLHIIVTMISKFKWNLNIMIYLISLYLIILFILIVSNIFWFYYGFELLLLPIYLMVYYWGYTLDKKNTGILFIYFALVSSLLWLISIIYIYSTGLDLIINPIIILILFLIPILVKVPVMPLHLWLNEVHTGSPLSGSILLAGIILKISIYAYLVFISTVFNNYYIIIQDILIIIAIISVIYSGYSTIRQIDYKRLIAYSSINHMNIILYSILSGTYSGIYSSILFCIAHGIVSSILFIQSNQISENINTRNLIFIRGLLYLLPILTLFGLFAHLANASFPPSINWFSELFILAYNLDLLSFTTYLISFTIILGIYFSIWSFFRIYFGILSDYNFTCNFILEFILNISAVILTICLIFFYIL